MTRAPDPNEVTAALQAQGLSVDADEAERRWQLVFTINASDHPALLLLFENADYFMAIAPIRSARLRHPLSELDAESLRAILRAQAETQLAKFHVVNESQGIYAAVSACSIEQWTGEKLARRLYACADLAAKIRAVLLELGHDPDRR